MGQYNFSGEMVCCFSHPNTFGAGGGCWDAMVEHQGVDDTSGGGSAGIFRREG
jgi:hypothetical protein